MMHELHISNSTKQRLDDAFYEMQCIESKCSDLTNKYTELKNELLKIQEEVKSIRIGIGLLFAALIIAEIIKAVMS